MNVADPASQTVVVVLVMPPVPESPVGARIVAVVVEIGVWEAVIDVGIVTVSVVGVTPPPDKLADVRAVIAVPVWSETAPD